MFAVNVEFWISFIYLNYEVVDCLAMMLAVSRNMPNTVDLYAFDLVTIPCTDDETVGKSTITLNISFSGLYPSMAFNPQENRLYFINDDVVFSKYLDGSSVKKHDYRTKTVVAFDLDIERQLLICASAAFAELGPNRYFIEKFRIGSDFKQTIIGDLPTVVTVIVDAVNQRVFWGSISFGASIESINYDGSNRIKYVNSLMAILLDVDPWSEIIYYSKLGFLRYQRYNESESRKVDHSVNALVILSTGDIISAQGNKLEMFNLSIASDALTIYNDSDNSIKFNKIAVISDCSKTSNFDRSSLHISTKVTEHTSDLLRRSTASPTTYSRFAEISSHQSKTDETSTKALTTYSTPTINVIIIVSVLVISLIATSVTLTCIAKLRKSTRSRNANTERLYEGETET